MIRKVCWWLKQDWIFYKITRAYKHRSSITLITWRCFLDDYFNYTINSLCILEMQCILLHLCKYTIALLYIFTLKVWNVFTKSVIWKKSPCGNFKRNILLCTFWMHQLWNIVTIIFFAQQKDIPSYAYYVYVKLQSIWETFEVFFIFSISNISHHKISINMNHR